MQKIDTDLNIFKLGLLELKEKRIWLKEFVLAEFRSFPTAFLQPGDSQRLKRVSPRAWATHLMKIWLALPVRKTWPEFFLRGLGGKTVKT